MKVLRSSDSEDRLPPIFEETPTRFSNKFRPLPLLSLPFDLRPILRSQRSKKRNGFSIFGAKNRRLKTGKSFFDLRPRRSKREKVFFYIRYRRTKIEIFFEDGNSSKKKSSSKNPLSSKNSRSIKSVSEQVLLVERKLSTLKRGHITSDSGQKGAYQSSGAEVRNETPTVPFADCRFRSSLRLRNDG